MSDVDRLLQAVVLLSGKKEAPLPKPPMTKPLADRLLKEQRTPQWWVNTAREVVAHWRETVAACHAANERYSLLALGMYGYVEELEQACELAWIFALQFRVQDAKALKKFGRSPYGKGRRSFEVMREDAELIVDDLAIMVAHESGRMREDESGRLREEMQRAAAKREAERPWVPPDIQAAILLVLEAAGDSGLASWPEVHMAVKKHIAAESSDHLRAEGAKLLRSPLKYVTRTKGPKKRLRRLAITRDGKKHLALVRGR